MKSEIIYMIVIGLMTLYMHIISRQADRNEARINMLIDLVTEDIQEEEDEE